MECLDNEYAGVIYTNSIGFKNNVEWIRKI